MRNMRLYRMLLSAVALVALIAVPAGLAYAQPDVRRLGGANRYETMARIVEEGFASSPWAVVATGSNYPDALAASALAGAKNCPVILAAKPGRICFYLVHTLSVKAGDIFSGDNRALCPRNFFPCLIINLENAQ